MSPLLLTLSFLTLMSIFTSSEMKTFIKGSGERYLYDGYLQNEKKIKEERLNAYLEDFSEDKSEETSGRSDTRSGGNNERENVKKSLTPLNYNEKRPPNNARLNFYDLFNDNRKQKKIPQTFSNYETAAQLIRSLYSEFKFFNGISRAEYQILDRLIERRDQAVDFIFPDELASIDLEDQVLQEIFYLMMKGGREGEKKYPSLLNFIAYQEGVKKNKSYRRRKINFLFAPAPILEAIFPDKNTYESLLCMRKEKIEWIHELERDREKYTDKNEWPGRRGVSQIIQESFTAILNQNQVDPDYVKAFDFSFGSPGQVLFLHDTESGEWIREKFTPKKR